MPRIWVLKYCIPLGKTIIERDRARDGRHAYYCARTTPKSLNTLVKIGIVGVLAAAALYQYARSRPVVSFKLVDFGLPSFSAGMLTLPLVLQFDNSAPVAIPVDELRVKVSYLSGSSYIDAGGFDRSQFTLQPGSTTIRVSPVVDLRSIASNVLDTIASIARAGGLDIRADIVASIKGVTVSETVQKRLQV